MILFYFSQKKTREGFSGWKHIHIFDSKGQLISVVYWFVDDLFFEDMHSVDDLLGYIATTIEYDCDQHISKTKSWWSLSNTTFYMHYK